MHVQPSSGDRCLIFGQTHSLFPYFTCANSEGSGEIAWMCRLARAFAGRLCDKYHDLMSWLICKQTTIIKTLINCTYNSCVSSFSGLRNCFMII